MSTFLGIFDIYLLIGVVINALLVNFKDSKILNKNETKKNSIISKASVIIAILVFVLFIVNKII